MLPQKYRPLIVPAVVTGIWLLVSVLTTTQWHMIDATYDKPQPWLYYFGPAITANLIWALMTPLIAAIAQRVPFERGAVARFFALHFLAGMLVAISHTIIYVLLLGLLFGGDEKLNMGAALLFRKLATSYQINLLIYAIIVAVVVSRRAFRNLHARELDAARLEARLAEAETQALRAQLQPHFLFNALNAISALVRSEPLKAERLIARLGDLLRLSIDGHREAKSPLRAEIDFTEAYLAIEQARMGERLRVVRQIAPDSLSAEVPSLLLQPLIENAVRHGIAPKPEGGTLTVTTAISGEELHITVADDGVGAGAMTDGIGLGNTRQRLARLYGKRQSLEITTAKDQGFCVTIKVPL